MIRFLAVIISEKTKTFLATKINFISYYLGDKHQNW